MKTYLTLIYLFLACFGAVGADAPNILTPKPGPAPRVNGPLVYGCGPGHPFLYRVPCQGDRPIRFSAFGLPKSLKLDPQTGIITGLAPAQGEYQVTLRARNSHGKDQRSFKIVSGDTLALTPPMGWNDWYAHYDRITDNMVREAADIMVTSGLADVGYQYVNIDDCWENAEKARDTNRVGPARDAVGRIMPNKYFPNMQALTAYIHQKGLKAGIYSSPGPKTCAGFTASFGHEADDAKTFSDWGFDFLKYDWCSYTSVSGGDKSNATLQKPYMEMSALLKQQQRDIVFNLCQYGMGRVWEWGQAVGGHCWRTAGDLGYELNSFVKVALNNADHRAWSRPGSWNDPDYIQIGYIGSAKGGGMPEPCKSTPDEQYTLMSMWCLMAAPLFYSGDMNHLDEFTLNVLANPEVIDVDQDPLGQSAAMARLTPDTFMLIKDMEDGSKVVGLFNQRDTATELKANWSVLGARGPQKVRDLWRQKDLGMLNHEFSAQVPSRGVALIRLWPKKG